MTRYIVLFRAPESVAERFARATPEEAQVGVRAWTDWFQKVGSALVDPGAPLANATTVTGEGVTRRENDIIGMSILQADSMDGVLKMVENHHHLLWADGCEITVLEEMPIPEFSS